MGALRWSLLLNIGEQGVRLLVSVIIARMLLPREYGITAMITVFVGLAEVLINSGFAKALIQSEQPTQLELSSVFYFNIAISTVCAVLLAAAGPFIASFYRLPILAPLAAVMSIDLIISGFGLVQITLLTKKLDFKTQFWARLAGTVFSGALGIGMAWRGFGVWSLVGQSLSANAISIGYYWLTSRWRPSLTFRISALRSMFAFGSKLLGSGVLDVVFKNIYVIVIGKAFSPFELGLYTRALQLQQLPVDNIASISDRVLFSSFTAVQHDKERLKRALRRTTISLALITFPLMVGIGILAKPIVLFALTAKWAGCIHYLQLMCIAGALYPMQMVNLSALTAQGRSDLFLLLEIVKKVVLLAVVAVSWRFGIVAMIYGQILVMTLSFYLNSFYTGRILAYGFWTQIRDMAPYATVSALMGGLLYLSQSIGPQGAVLVIITRVCAGGLIYITACRIFALEAFMDLLPQVFPGLRRITKCHRSHRMYKTNHASRDEVYRSTIVAETE